MAKKRTPNRASYVEALQAAVERAARAGDELDQSVKEVAPPVARAAARARIEIAGQSERTDTPGLRVTCPSASVVSAEIPASLPAELVEFYITRPRGDGTPETRLLGVAKYKDGDGKWRVDFTTRRFSRRPDDPVVIHAEVLGEGGRLLAAAAMGSIV